MEQSRVTFLVDALTTHKEAIEKMHKDINRLTAEITIVKYVLIDELYEIHKKLFGSEFANAKKELIEKIIDASLERSLSKVSEMEGINNGEINKGTDN